MAPPNTQGFENIDDMLLNEVDITGFEATPVVTPAARAALAHAHATPTASATPASATPASAASVQSSVATTQVSTANSSATSQPQASHKRGRLKGSMDKVPRMTKARKLAMQQGSNVQR